MCKTVHSAGDLGAAIKSGEERIIVTGTLGNAVFRIEKIGRTRWKIAMYTIALAGVWMIPGIVVDGYVPPRTLLNDLAAAAAAAAVGGSKIILVLWEIAAAGGIETLSVMRDYAAMRKGENVVLVKRR